MGVHIRATVWPYVKLLWPLGNCLESEVVIHMNAHHSSDHIPCGPVLACCPLDFPLCLFQTCVSFFGFKVMFFFYLVVSDSVHICCHSLAQCIVFTCKTCLFSYKQKPLLISVLSVLVDDDSFKLFFFCRKIRVRGGGVLRSAAGCVKRVMNSIWWSSLFLSITGRQLYCQLFSYSLFSFDA